MPVNWESVRAEFPALENWTFLNTATYGQLARRTQQAMVDHLHHRDELACTDFLSWFDKVDEIRAAIALLINATADDITFITNASSALSLLIGGIDWRSGDQIVTLENEFPNNLYNPAVLGGRGVQTLEVPYERFEQALTYRTRMVAISTINYTTGFRAPLEEIAAICKKRGITLYLDGTQGLGALTIDIDKIQPDMYAVDGYKWLLSPNAAGFVYVHPRLRARLDPNVIGWRSHKDWRRVDNLHHGAPEFTTTAEKYEGGMINFPGIFAMGASIDMMLHLGPKVIEDRVMSLAAYCRDRLTDAGGFVAHHDSPILATLLPGRDASALARELKEQRIVVSARHGRLRVSTHFYNNEADVDTLVNALR